MHHGTHGGDDLSPPHSQPRLLLIDEFHGRGSEPLAALELLFEQVERGLVPLGAVLGGDQHTEESDGAVVPVGDIVKMRAEDVEAVEVQELCGLFEGKVGKSVRQGNINPIVFFVVSVEERVLNGHGNIIAARNSFKELKLRQEPPRIAPNDVRFTAFLHVLNQSLPREYFIRFGVESSILVRGR